MISFAAGVVHQVNNVKGRLSPRSELFFNTYCHFFSPNRSSLKQLDFYKILNIKNRAMTTKNEDKQETAHLPSRGTHLRSTNVTPHQLKLCTENIQSRVKHTASTQTLNISQSLMELQTEDVYYVYITYSLSLSKQFSPSFCGAHVFTNTVTFQVVTTVGRYLHSYPSTSWTRSPVHDQNEIKKDSISRWYKQEA